MALNNTTPANGGRRGMASVIQTVANIGVIVASACVLWVALQRIQPTKNEPPPVYAIGDQVDAIDGIDFRASPRTLVMALREDCRYCQDSASFYRRLSEAVERSTGRRTRLLVVSTDPALAMSAYLKGIDIHVDRVVTMRSGALKIPGTPLLLLVDDHGIVTHVWRGRLAASQEQEVLAELAITSNE